MKRLQPNETDLTGQWISNRGGVVGDAVTERIEWLTAEVLEKIALSPEEGAWETVFRGPNDGRYWERTYPQGEKHGGGPPRLTCISDKETRRKYRLL